MYNAMAAATNEHKYNKSHPALASLDVGVVGETEIRGKPRPRPSLTTPPNRTGRGAKAPSYSTKNEQRHIHRVRDRMSPAGNKMKQTTPKSGAGAAGPSSRRLSNLAYDVVRADRTTQVTAITSLRECCIAATCAFFFLYMELSRRVSGPSSFVACTGCH